MAKAGGKGKTTISGGKKGQKPVTFQKGGLHRSLGVPQGQKIPASKMAAAKAGKQAKAKTIMREWKAGDLHSGSKKGPIVKSQKQAVAIMLAQTGRSRAKRKKK